MGFVKTLKTRQYYKRYQTKFRRRREHKTDYYARKRMILQDVNKLGCQKYRLVVRFTNRQIIAQIAYSTLEGDRILCHASTTELKKWGLTTGLTNYASGYSLGLLISRRLLKKIGLDSIYKGTDEIDGKDYNVAALAETYQNSKRPFKAILDIGLVRSTVGNRVYAVLKGACDGGLYVPHNTRNFYGAYCQKDDKKRSYHYAPEKHRDRIFGVHIDQYMEIMKEENEDKYNKHFSQWIKCLEATGAESVEDLYEKVNAGIRTDPARATKVERKKTPQTYEDDAKTIIVTKKGKYKRDRRLTNAQRKARVQLKIKLALEQD